MNRIMAIQNTTEGNFHFGEYWNDDIRMNALFQPFRSKGINSTEYESKMKFWENLISDWCKFHKKVLVTQQDMILNFTRNGKVPNCLTEVFQNLYSKSTIVSLDTFHHITETSWTRWTVKKAAMPLKWAVEIVYKKNIDTYIHLPTIKFLAEEIVSNISNRGELMHEKKLQALSGIENKEEFYLVMKYLESQKKVSASGQQEHFKLYKFPKPGEKISTITKVDEAIFTLKEDSNSLKNSIERLEKEKELAMDEARKYVAAKMRSLAKTSLRKKRELERCIEKRASALDNVQGLLLKLEQAELDEEILKSYKLGSTSLKQIRASGLTVENVNQTMDELEDVLMDHAEMEQALARSTDPALDELLEEELDQLLQDENRNSSNGDAGHTVPNLPDVPSSSPGKVDTAEDDLVKRLNALTA